MHEICTTHFMISTLIIWKDPLPVDCGKGPSQNMMMKKSDIYDDIKYTSRKMLSRAKILVPKILQVFFVVVYIIVYIKPFKAKYWQKNLFFPGQFCAISRHVTSHHTCAIFQTNYVQISSFFKKGQNRVVVERSLKFGTTETGEGGDVRATVGGG